MEHAASIGSGTPAAHAAPAAPAASSPARAPAAPAGTGYPTCTAVSISPEGQARADGDAAGGSDGPHPVLLAAHIALAALGEPDGLVGDVAQVAVGYAAQAGFELAGRIDEIV